MTKTAGAVAGKEGGWLGAMTLGRVKRGANKCNGMGQILASRLLPIGATGAMANEPE